jgi:hypothetical protein
VIHISGREGIITDRRGYDFPDEKEGVWIEVIFTDGCPYQAYAKYLKRKIYHNKPIRR